MADELREKENNKIESVVVPNEPKCVDPNQLKTLPSADEDVLSSDVTRALPESNTASDEDSWHIYSPKDIEDAKAKAHNRAMDADARRYGYYIIAGCLIFILIVFTADVIFPGRSELSPVVIEICKTSLLVVFGYIFGKGSAS